VAAVFFFDRRGCRWQVASSCRRRRDVSVSTHTAVPHRDTGPRGPPAARAPVLTWGGGGPPSACMGSLQQLARCTSTRPPSLCGLSCPPRLPRLPDTTPALASVGSRCRASTPASLLRFGSTVEFSRDHSHNIRELRSGCLIDLRSFYGCLVALSQMKQRNC